MAANEYLNEAIKQIKIKIKDIGISEKSLMFDWWVNNGSPAIFITFANDIAEDGTPIINNEYDEIKIASPLKFDKIDSIEAAIKLVKNKIVYNQNAIRAEYENLEYEEVFVKEDVQRFLSYFDRIMDVVHDL